MESRAGGLAAGGVKKVHLFYGGPKWIVGGTVFEKWLGDL